MQKTSWKNNTENLTWQIDEMASRVGIIAYVDWKIFNTCKK